ncbi:hypothetical protein AGMMS49944_14110 [Spirochaetia bacterium]|nr:hypothetical protein AGMMS49944_14110 [Spirochaetia bacterium]
MFKAGAITAEEMRRYDSSCLVSPSDTPQGRAARTPAMATASPGPGRSVK